MNQWRLFYVAVCAALLMGSCSKAPLEKIPDDQETPAPKPKAEDEAPVLISAAVHESISGFSFSFFKALQKQQPAGHNLFASPLSLHIALSMLANGASGTTKDEILKVLQAEDLSGSTLNKDCLALLETLPNADPAVTFQPANAVFYKNNFPVEASFLKTLGDYYKTQTIGLPFKPSDLPVINKWASDHTNGKIPTVLEELDSNLVLLLMNALYFKGDWSTKFDKNRTVAATFLKEDGTRMQTAMMRQTDTVLYASTNEFQSIQKPYGNGQFTMTILLPKTSAVANLFNQMDTQKWNALLKSFKPTKVGIELPRFKLQQAFKLIPVLEAMGIRNAFDPQAANFSAFSREPTFVSLVQQSTYVSVDEDGTEAAAVTAAGATGTSGAMYPYFICNRPFGIIISENTSKSILFMGSIYQPVAIL
ncbi:serpin family protein [Niabella pedocola]|uniref:Serpin family protein n=1 Tax=Niabella pedocola TaxID=1752077 RepID=A0ABS8PK95_9BACT|nr:serpin family protein [Niabella pedocola]MCD2421300.1 serpin family protein [Niabella pedocola]